MMHTKPSLFSWFYFIKSGYKTHQQFGVFVIDVVNIFLAEVTNHGVRFMNYFLASEGDKDSQIFIAKRRRKCALHMI